MDGILKKSRGIDEDISVRAASTSIPRQEASDALHRIVESLISFIVQGPAILPEPEIGSDVGGRRPFGVKRWILQLSPSSPVGRWLHLSSDNRDIYGVRGHSSASRHFS